MYNRVGVGARRQEKKMTDDSADHTVPANFVAWNSRRSTPAPSAVALEAGALPVYRAPALRLPPPAEQPPPSTRVTTNAARRAAKRPVAVTDSPPHSVTIALDRGDVDTVPMAAPPPVVVPRRTSSRRATKRAKQTQPAPTNDLSPPAREQAIVQTAAQPQPARPTIRTLLTTTAQDDDDESDSEDDLLNNDEDEERSPHVRFAVPLVEQLDQLAAAAAADTTPVDIVPSAAAPPKPVPYQPPRPTVVSDNEFIANMMKRSTARPVDESAKALDGVELLPERFEQFQSDSADEFFDANKPPWAPRIAERALRNARKWKAMEIYDNFDLKQMDWYAFLELVTGFADNDDVSEYAQTLTFGDRSGLIAPTRVGDRPGVVGTLGAAATASGAGIIDAAVAGMLSPDVRPAPISYDGAPSGLFAPSGGGGGGGRSAAPPPPSFRTAFGNGGDDIPHGFPADFTSLMTSTGRLAPERQELLEKLHAPEMLDIDTPTDREQRRKERLDMVRALPYINRPQATGVFLLNPKYIAALSAAYTKIQVYAGPDTTLRNVPRSEFMRRRSTRETGGDSASDSVRSTFAELVACYLFLARDSRHRGNQFKSDRQANEDRANELLRLLRYRFGYNAERRVFYDVTPANDERYQARCARYSHRAPTAAPFNTVFPVGGTALPGYLFPVGPAAYRPV